MAKTFVDFIADTAKDKGMAQDAVGIIKNKSNQDLSDWFKQKGYDVSKDDCQILLDSKDELWEIGDVAVKSNY